MWSLKAAVMAAALGVAAVSADAKMVYLGIGNDEFTGDVGVAQSALAPYLPAGGSASTELNKTGQQIVASLTAVKNTLQSGDVLIFHYSGHGSTTASGSEGDNAIGVIDNLPFGAGSWATDDDIAGVINMIPECVAVMAVFDSCYAGEMVDGAGDISRGAVVGTSGATCKAPGESIFLPLWNAAFAIGGNGKLGGDTNADGTLSFGEFFDALSGIAGDSEPFATYFDGPTSPHLNYTVAMIPLPPAMLSGLVLMGVFAITRRRGL